MVVIFHSVIIYLIFQQCDRTNSQTFPVVNVQDTTIKLGEDAVITCDYTLTGSTRTLLAAQWYNSTSIGDRLNQLVNTLGTNPNGRYTVDTSQTGVATLTIANTMLPDDGYYLCNILDSNGENGEHLGKLTVYYFDSGSNLMIDVNSITAPHNVIITCSGFIDGSPVPYINLYKDNNIIKIQNSLPMIYTIATVSEDDGRMYRCEANNSVGSVTSNTITLDYYLTGTITISSTSNDTTIVFNCSGSVNGNPSADIILHKDGDIIRQQSTLPLIYTISSPTESDAGHYTCQADNTAFSTRSSVLELYKPILEENTVGPGENYVVTFDGEANPQQVTYVWSIDGVVDPDANSATFTFTASMEVGTVHEITVIVTNLIGSTSKTIRITVSATNIKSTTNSAKTTMPSTETTVGPCNTNIGLIIGMLFVGIIIGAGGLYIGQIIYNKIRKKSLSEKQDTGKNRQDTYMDYVGENSGQNQTYQDLQHKEEESAYVNVRAGNKKKGKV